VSGKGGSIGRAFIGFLVMAVFWGEGSSNTLPPGAARDDFPSCYGLIDRPDLAQAPPGRALFIIVDQTVRLDPELRRGVHLKVQRFLHPGDRITLLTFSANAKGRYASMPLTGRLDPPLDEKVRYHVSVAKLKKFDRCMKKQWRYVRRTIDTRLEAAFGQAASNLPRTELAGSLARFGETVIARSRAARKVVLLVSDMFENSDIVTFYSRGAVRPIDIDHAIGRIKSAGLYADWRGAGVYVIGAGFIGGGGYRSEKLLRNLRRFWEAYLRLSNAELAGWGAPELLVELR